jgi:hypothetical protein
VSGAGGRLPHPVGGGESPATGRRFGPEGRYRSRSRRRVSLAVSEVLPAGSMALS